MYLQLILALCSVNYCSAKYSCGKSWFPGNSGHDIGPKDNVYAYSGPSRCDYTIQTRGNSYYTILEWDSFYVDDDMPTCSRSRVEVYIGCNNPTKVVFCSRIASKPFPIVSRDGCIKITVKTDRSLAHALFTAHYNTYPNYDGYAKTCPSENQMVSFSGLISSRNWPSNYGNTMPKCKWEFTFEQPENVVLFFFDLEMDRAKYRSLGTGCVRSFDDLVGIKLERYSYEYKYCNLDRPKLLQFKTSYFSITMENNERYYEEHKNRGFILGYFIYRDPEVIAVSASESGGLSVAVVAILSTVGAIFICGCCCGCCYYACKDDTEDTDNVVSSGNVGVPLTDFQSPSQQQHTPLDQRRTPELHPTNNHEIIYSETSPMYNPELSEQGPPSYSNHQLPSAPPIQQPPAFDEPPPPSYNEYISGNY